MADTLAMVVDTLAMVAYTLAMAASLATVDTWDAVRSCAVEMRWDSDSSG
jgi:hypothetical protein